MQSTFTAFFDANVFFGVRLRSFVMEVAKSGLFRARWSRDVHDEWIRAVVRRRQDLTAERLRPVADQMDAAIPDALVTGYETLVPSLELPDPDDRHVLAAAITGRADVIVTFNVGDFPAQAIDGFGIHTKHPDRFFREVDGIVPGTIVEAAIRDLAHYKNPPLSAERYADDLEKAGVPLVASHLRKLRVLFEQGDRSA